MLNAARIPRKFVGYFVLFAMFNWLFLPFDIKEKQVFAGQNRQLTEAFDKNVRENVPLYFEANRGQLDRRVKFSARGAGYKLFLTSSEAVYVIPERKAEEAQKPNLKNGIFSPQAPKSSRAAAVWMKLSGANQNTLATGVGELAGKHNYFKGSDESKWQTDVPLYQRAKFENVYQGVDMEWRGNEAGGIEYDFKVSPDVSARQIEWQIEGADKVTVEADGSLTISTAFGELKQQAPVSYQEIDGLRNIVESRFELRGENRVGFTLGEYDRSKLLTIDPATDLKYSSFLGGEDDEQGFAIAAGNSNTVYITGYTYSTSFPTTAGVFDTTNNGSNDVFVTKLDTRGGEPIYSTYIGGGGGDYARAIAVDTSGNAYITGSASDSVTPFPTTSNVPFPMTRGGERDAFITELNPTGSDLVYSTFLGGNSPDYGAGIAILSGEAYVTGFTNSADFTTTPGAFDTTYNGGAFDIFVAKLSRDGVALIYSTLIGSPDIDVGEGITVDGSGNVSICGWTGTPNSNYPTTPGAFDVSSNGNLDTVVTKLSADGSALIYSTLLGGSAADAANAIAVDQFGNAYITGITNEGGIGAPFPTTPGAFDTTLNGSSLDVFVTKLNPTGTELAYSTFLGGGGDDNGRGIAVNAAGNAFVTGYTDNVATPFPTTAGAFDITNNGGIDIFLTKMSATGSSLIYSTFIGGNGDEQANAVALDVSGDAFITGRNQVAAIAFPTTANAFQPNINGSNDAFVCKFAATSNVPVERAPFDFDGDGKTDISIFRPTAGEWWYLKSSNGGNSAAAFGVSTDKPMPGDFSGDGKTDIAFFRPSNGFWYILRSEDFSFYSFPFGNSTDLPAPADYDGDDKTDAAVFRPSDATWYISKSTGGTLIRQFGANGDTPVVSDYDGDGRADIAIYRVSLGQWWINRSSNDSTFALQFGAPTDKPVQGDYTGDGKADVAFWRPSTGEWFFLRSEDFSFYSFPFGANGDLPVPGDYDGDGKFDAGVFRPSGSTWFINKSNGGTLIQTFGIAGDKPVPNAFVP